MNGLMPYIVECDEYTGMQVRHYCPNPGERIRLQAQTNWQHVLRPIFSVY